jgi:hypothetical protein
LPASKVADPFGVARREEGRGARNDEMIRLEPGRKAPPAALARMRELAEAHKGRHLVAVAPHGFRQPSRLHHIGIGSHGQKMPFALQPMEQTVEQRKRSRIAVADDGFGQFRKGRGHNGPRHRRLRPGQSPIRRGKQPALAFEAPVHLVRRDARLQQPARRVAPFTKIAPAGKTDPVHHNPGITGPASQQRHLHGRRLEQRPQILPVDEP